MILNKHQYLVGEHVKGFVGALAQLMDGQPLHYPHTFSVRDRGGLYREYPHLVDGSEGSRLLHIETLEGAFNRYWWDGQDFASNEKRLLEVQSALRAAINMAECSEVQTAAYLDAIHTVLEWGAGGTGLKLYTANMAWARKHASTLIGRISAGIRAIDSDSPDLAIFGDDDGPRMNAGYTKLFALACKASVIYDGRVGAALGLLVRMYCEERRLQQVPDDLAFRWSAQTSSGKTLPLPRNPSWTPYVFGQLRNDGRTWAAWNVKANWILSAARTRTRNSAWCDGDDGLRRIEAALFTIGYHLPVHCSICGVDETTETPSPCQHRRPADLSTSR